MQEKRRQPFGVWSTKSELLAMGVLYDDGNVQVLWRKSLGWTGEQFHSIAQMFGVESGARVVAFTERLPTPPMDFDTPQPHLTSPFKVVL